MVVSLNTTDCKALVTVPNACAPCKQVPIQNVVWRRGWGREGDVLKLKLQLNRMGLLYRWPCVQQYTGESGNQCKFCCTGRWASLWKRRATHTHTHTAFSHENKNRTKPSELTFNHTHTHLNIPEHTHMTMKWKEKKRKKTLQLVVNKLVEWWSRPRGFSFPTSTIMQSCLCWIG